MPGGWLLAVLGIVLALCLGGAESAWGLCVPACSAPFISDPQVQVVSAQSARFTATVNPEGSDTRYQFVFAGPYQGQYQGQYGVSPAAIVPAGYAPTQLSWQPVGLVPNTSYEVELQASNQYGSSTSQQVAFHTPLLGPAPVVMRLVHSVVRVGTDPMVTAGVGAEESGAVGYWQFAYPPFTQFRSLNSGPVPNSGVVRYPVPDPLWPFNGPGGLRRNLRLRFVLTGVGGAFPEPYQTREPSISSSRLLYVLPDLVIHVHPEVVERRVLSPGQSLFRPDGFFQIYLSIVAPLARGYRGPLVYVYTATRGGRRYRRLGSARPRFVNNTYDYGPSGLVALRIHHPGLNPRGRFLVCTRLPLVADMGARFRFLGCGRRVLRPGGPIGAEELIRDLTPSPVIAQRSS